MAWGIEPGDLTAEVLGEFEEMQGVILEGIVEGEERDRARRAARQREYSRGSYARRREDILEKAKVKWLEVKRDPERAERIRIQKRDSKRRLRARGKGL